MEYLVKIVREVLANHQVTGYWWHWLDDRKVSNMTKPIPHYQTEANIYSFQEAAY